MILLTGFKERYQLDSHLAVPFKSIVSLIVMGNLENRIFFSKLNWSNCKCNHKMENLRTSFKVDSKHFLLYFTCFCFSHKARLLKCCLFV